MTAHHSKNRAGALACIKSLCITVRGRADVFLLAAVMALACFPAAAETIVVGQVAELSGQDVVADNVAGAALWFNHVNKDPHGTHRYVLKQ